MQGCQPLGNKVRGCDAVRLSPTCVTHWIREPLCLYHLLAESVKLSVSQSRCSNQALGQTIAKAARGGEEMAVGALSISRAGTALTASGRMRRDVYVALCAIASQHVRRVCSLTLRACTCYTPRFPSTDHQYPHLI